MKSEERSRKRLEFEKCRLMIDMMKTAQPEWVMTGPYLVDRAPMKVDGIERMLGTCSSKDTYENL